VPAVSESRRSPSSSAVQSPAISAGAWTCSSRATASGSRAATSCGVAAARLPCTSVKAVVICPQNSSAAGSGALPLEGADDEAAGAEVLGAATGSSSPDPPQAVSRTTTAAPARAERSSGAGERMGPTVVAARAGVRRARLPCPT
jgi:hypothetical protein